MPDTDSKRRFIVNAAYFAVWVAIVFLVFRYLLNLIWPFFAAFLFASLLRPLIRWLTAKCHVKYTVSAVLCLIVFFAVIGGLAVLITSRVISLAADVMSWLPSLYGDMIEPGLNNLTVWIEELANRIGPEVYDVVDEALPSVVSSIGTSVMNASRSIVAALSGWVAKLPSRLLSTLICAIATVFMTLDYSRMNAFIMRQIPERPRHILAEARGRFGVILRQYGKSYGIIMCITFAEILAGLLIIGQKNAALIALAIAVFDIFPIVGAGMILVPWGVVTLLGGAVGKGVGLLVLWGVTIIVRQIIEPRIVGRQVGLHPLITLAAMFVGSKLFGAVGLFGLPITCAIVKSLDEAGVIHLIRREGDGAKRSGPGDAGGAKSAE